MTKRNLSNPKNIFLAAILLLGGTEQAFSQTTSGANVLTTAMPFLNIPVDARAAGMGDVGVSTSFDANASFWNPSKTVFSEKKYGVALSYTPWLKSLVNDMSLSYLTGFYKINERQALDIGLTYFNLGSIQYTDANGASLGDGRPREFAIRAHYSTKLSDQFSIAVGGFYANSNITQGLGGSGSANPTRPGNTAGADISAFYRKTGLTVAQLPLDISAGVNISNIGAKVSYGGNNQRDFIPTNFRIGSTGKVSLDPYNKLAVSLEFNKLLVPTPPLRDPITNNIISGKDPRDITLLQGIFGSFSDAPGGFSEELREFMINFGTEYSYSDEQGNELFLVRGGYVHEAQDKGDRKYFTAGIGARYQVFGLDVAYMIPTTRSSPLANTLRFTLHLNFGSSNNNSNSNGVPETAPAN